MLEAFRITGVVHLSSVWISSTSSSSVVEWVPGNSVLLGCVLFIFHFRIKIWSIICDVFLRVVFDVMMMYIMMICTVMIFCFCLCYLHILHYCVSHYDFHIIISALFFRIVCFVMLDFKFINSVKVPLCWTLNRYSLSNSISKYSNIFPSLPVTSCLIFISVSPYRTPHCAFTFLFIHIFIQYATTAHSSYSGIFRPTR